jgi:hypothetical protein
MDYDVPPCIEYAPDYGDIPVPAELARDGVVRIIAWTCLDPACPQPRDDDGPRDRPAVHYVMFHEGQDQPLGLVDRVASEVHRRGPPAVQRERQPRHQPRRQSRRARHRHG